MENKLKEYIEKLNYYNKIEDELFNYKNENPEIKLKKYFSLLEFVYKILPPEKIEWFRQQKIEDYANFYTRFKDFPKK